MRKLLKLFVAFMICLLAALPAQAESNKQLEITRVSLLSDTLFIEGGKSFELGVLLEPKQNWHSYWENPGDAGLPTELIWELPKGFTASDIHWPVPERINEGPLTVYGYHDTVFLPVTITPPETLDKRSYTISVKANWLICEEICIPESATLDINLVAGTSAPSPEAEYFMQNRQSMAHKVVETLHATHDDKYLALSVPLAVLSLDSVSKADFYIRNDNVISHAAKPQFSVTDGFLKLKLERAGKKPEGAISGILFIQDGLNTHYFDVSFSNTEGTEAPTTPVQNPQVTPFLPVILLLALAGGIILNLMPCVLPVLSLKALTLVKKSTADRRMARHHGIAYTVGILLSFAVLASILISLQHAGEAVGWGYQMQSPVFVGMLVYLLLFVGLNLSGFFDLPVLLGNTGTSLTNEASARGSFFTGVLATAVATPCTAPFMASAVGVALTLPSWQAMLVFESLGLGLALPFLLISFFPALLRFLPKPGTWMESFKQLLAFPMYASTIWLIWVLTLQTGAEGTLYILSGMLLVVLAIWMKRLFSNRHVYRLSAIALISLVIFGTLQMLKDLDAMPNQTAMHAEGYQLATVDYEPEALNALRQQGKAVFVDATAAWCITCQVNDKTAIHTDRVMMTFKERGITLMIADWTRRSPKIKEFLASFGYQGVPLYVYYPANGGEPVVLPQILTPGIILETINPKGEML